MNSPSQSGSGVRDTTAKQPASKPGKTPNADMQAEDAGSADSGDAGSEDSATEATRAMKQTSKTSAESGDKR